MRLLQSIPIFPFSPIKQITVLFPFSSQYFFSRFISYIGDGTGDDGAWWLWLAQILYIPLYSLVFPNDGGGFPLFISVMFFFSPFRLLFDGWLENCVLDALVSFFFRAKLVVVLASYSMTISLLVTFLFLLFFLPLWFSVLM